MSPADGARHRHVRRGCVRPVETVPTASSSPQLVLPKLVEKPERVAAQAAPRSMAPATTAASVRREAQRALMEDSESGAGAQPATPGGSRGSVSSSRASSAGSATGRRSAGTSAPWTPTAPSSGSRASAPSRKVVRGRQVVAPSSAPARQTEGRPSSKQRTAHADGLAPDRPSSEPGTVGVINGVPFQTCDFGGLVEQWLTTSEKALSPKSRLRNSARTESRQDASNQKAKVEKAREKMRRAVEKIGTNDSSSIKSASYPVAVRGRGARDRALRS